jgi:E3 ubiquitin-protein ligase makorin
MFFTAADVETKSEPENIWASQSADSGSPWVHDSAKSELMRGLSSSCAPLDKGYSGDVSNEDLSYRDGAPGHRPPEAPLCRFFAAGRCAAGSACRFSHVRSHDHASDEFVCGICSESVLTMGRKFGLLDNCDCVFCLDCLREWRNQKEKQDRVNLRKCPLCRIDSYVVTPSTNFLVGEEKRAEREKYCQYLSTLPCKNHNRGQATCQFGTSCLYRHEGARPVNEFVVIKGADGTRTKRATQLSDYFRM